jgi:hypothetical protein
VPNDNRTVETDNLVSKISRLFTIAIKVCYIQTSKITQEKDHPISRDKKVKEISISNKSGSLKLIKQWNTTLSTPI